jgi:hypothetical protein
MAWFADNIEGALHAWFGSLTVVYDGDDAAAAAVAAAVAHGSASNASKAGDDVQQQQGEGVTCATATSAADYCGSECSGGCSSASSDNLQLLQVQDQQQQQQQGVEQQDGQAVGQPQQQQRHIFGFQPHGLYPTGAGFLPWMPSFKKHFPGVNPVTLTATVIFFPPFIRDICCWAGFRQVRHCCCCTNCYGDENSM